VRKITQGARHRWELNMEPTETPPLCSHLADFETTTSHLLRPQEARALLNFAALFHEVIYLTDTALGDHKLIINSFQQEGHSGLFFHVKRFIEEGILRVLCRDKVVVQDKVLVSSNPTIREIFEGWQYRDKVMWGGEIGFTTVVGDQVRLAYLREVDDLLLRFDAIHRYNPDVPKASFRDIVREQLNSEEPTMLSESVAQLPTELQREYFNATKDPWFTNAELWRVLKAAPFANESIILHAHINQLCFADITGAGQSGHDRSARSLASFNLELQRRQPLALAVDATLAPPKNLQELLESAPVQLRSPGVEMFDQLSVERVVALRRRAKPIFELAHRRIQRPHELEDLRRAYLGALEKYWGYIIETFEAMHPEKLVRPSRLGLFVERELPTLGWLYQKFGKSVFAVLLRLGLTSAPPPVSAPTGLVVDATHQLGVILLHERNADDKQLRGEVPPREWYPRGILGLDRVHTTRGNR